MRIPVFIILPVKLGNMYAVMEDYVEAVEHYTNALSKQSNFDQAASRRNAVLCQAKLHHKLEQQHESLKRTLDELRKFKGEVISSAPSLLMSWLRKARRVSPTSRQG